MQDKIKELQKRCAIQQNIINKQNATIQRNKLTIDDLFGDKMRLLHEREQNNKKQGITAEKAVLIAKNSVVVELNEPFGKITIDDEITSLNQLQAKITKLKSRNLWQRILNKEME